MVDLCESVFVQLGTLRLSGASTGVFLGVGGRLVWHLYKLGLSLARQPRGQYCYAPRLLRGA